MDSQKHFQWCAPDELYIINSTDINNIVVRQYKPIFSSGENGE